VALKREKAEVQIVALVVALVEAHHMQSLRYREMLLWLVLTDCSLNRLM